MLLLQIVSAQPGAGKTTFAVAIGLGLSHAGQRLTLIRLGDSEAARQDAATFAAYAFASSPGRPLPPAELTRNDGVTIVEADANAEPLAAAAVLIVRGGPTAEDATLGRALGARLLGTFATAVPPPRIEAVGRDLTNGGLRPLAVLGEDRILAAPSVGEIRDALGAEVLYAGENELETATDVIIAPVYADPARPHFRRFAAKAVLAPFNKTDLHLAAIESQATCLVITGGGEPSPYVIDRAQGEATTVLLAKGETPETVAALADVWLRSRFRGELKAETALSHLEGRIDFASLASRLGS